MAVTLERLLVPTDFGPASAKAINYASSFAKILGAELHLLNVVSHPHIDSEAQESWVEPQQTRMSKNIQSAEVQLDAEIGRCGVPFERVQKHVQLGSPVREILKYAQNNRIDLIVMGTQGRKGFANFVIGSVAEQVVQQASCPVLTVHPENSIV